MNKFMFKGKTTADDKWIFSSHYETDVLGNVFIDDERVHPDSVGLFTGFYDEDSSSVYEGDILTAHLSTVDVDLVIVWNSDEGKFQANYLSGGKFSDLSQAKLNHWRVTGRIFDRQ